MYAWGVNTIQSLCNVFSFNFFEHGYYEAICWKSLVLLSFFWFQGLQKMQDLAISRKEDIHLK
jgi:hypothetical protein